MGHIRSALAAFAFILLLLASLPLSAATIRVPADQPTIQAGIDAAVDGDTVLVAPGHYAGDGNWEVSFRGKAITVRSETGADECTIDCAWGGDRGWRAFSFDSGEGPGSVLEGFTITDCTSSNPWGGTVLVRGSSPTIRQNLFLENLVAGGGGTEIIGGGGISCVGGSSPLITGNRFIQCGTADSQSLGGAIFSLDSTPTILNNYIVDCGSGGTGGGICIYGGSAVIRNCTIEACGAEYGGGGIHIWDGEALISNCILWNNWWNGSKNQILLGYSPSYDPVLTIHHSCIEEGEDGALIYSGTLNRGEGMIEDDPVFAVGPTGSHYLSQVAAGQSMDSPCVDTGDPDGDMVDGSTRTDSRPDTGVVDMGGHYLNPDLGPRLVTGPGPSEENPPLVNIFLPVQDATPISQFPAYGADAWGVNVSCGRIVDLENDSIITGAGPGEIYGPHVRGWQSDGTPLPGVSFLAYGTSKFGVNVAAGDLDGDGYDEIVTGAGPGAVFGPHVRGWNVDGGTATPVPEVNFFAYGTLKYGVNVACGDLNGDSIDEIVTGAGPGSVFGPHVRGWKVDGETVAPIPGVSFFAYGTLKYGVNVAAGDVDRDGIDELLTAPGPSVAFASHIRGWNVDGGSVIPLDGCSFIAWSPTLPRFGAHISSGTDLDGDNRHEIVVGAGPDPAVGSVIRIFEYRDGVVAENISLQAYPVGWNHGVTVAAGSFQ